MLVGVRLGNSSVALTAASSWGGADAGAGNTLLASASFSCNEDAWTLLGGGRYNVSNNYSYGLGVITAIYGVA